MITSTISAILDELTNLLSDDLNPRLISYRFNNLAGILKKENIHIDKVSCKEYYEDGDLSLVLLMKNEALANGQFELASKFMLLEKELQEEKGHSQSTALKTEPFFFEYKGNSVVFHFNKDKENQRLIANLIEGYNLVHPRLRPYEAIAC